MFFFISGAIGFVTIFDQAFVQSIKSWQGEHVYVVSILKDRNVVVWHRTMDINLPR